MQSEPQRRQAHQQQSESESEPVGEFKIDFSPGLDRQESDEEKRKRILNEIRADSDYQKLLTSKAHFHPLDRLMDLPEYQKAGLKEWHLKEYFPNLYVNTVEDFLGLIRGTTRELADEVGTTEEQLIDLYNAAMATALPAMSSETVEEVMEQVYTLGLELTAPPSELTSSIIGGEQTYEQGLESGVLPAEISLELANQSEINREEETSAFQEYLSTVKSSGKNIVNRFLRYIGVASEKADVSPGAGVITGGVNLIDEHMPLIRDQGDRGTCVAFSTLAVLEYASHRALNTGHDLSEQYLYWNIKRTDNYPKEGTWLEFAFPLSKRDGVCREELWPYAPDKRLPDLTHDDPPNAPACAADALTHTFSRIIRLRDYRQPESIKNQLLQNRPVAVAIPVYKTWFQNPATRLSGKITLPLKSDRFALGGHAIVLVGFQEGEEGNYFIVRNSWGDRWGKESPFGIGYGRVPYAYIERYNTDAWTGVV